MTTDTTTARELLADVPRTDRLDERQDNASAHAAMLVGLFDAPTLKEVSKREWRTRYWMAGQLYTVLLTQPFKQPPDPDGLTTRIQVQLTCNHQAAPYHVKFLVLRGTFDKDYDVLDIVAFLGLDALAAEAVSWRDVTRYRTVLTVEGLVARATTGRPN